MMPEQAAHGFLGVMANGDDRALEIHEITFDARDPHALAAFWAALLEREIRPGDMPRDDSVLVVPTPGQPGLLFLRVPEGKTAKNRIHFDLWPTSTRRDEQIGRFLASYVLREPGDLRVIRTSANGQPALAVYQRASDGVHRAHVVQVLTCTTAGVARIVAFRNPGLFAAFGLPPELPA